MWLKQLIGALGALGLMWMVQLALFALIFSLILVIAGQIVVAIGARHVPILPLTCLLTFVLMARLQVAARRRGWGGRPAIFNPDL